MPRDTCVELIDGEVVATADYTEIVLRKCRRHQRALAPAQAAIAAYRRHDRRIDFELHLAAMARAFVYVARHFALRLVAGQFHMGACGACVAT
jgi:hypothetical protein